MTKNIYQNVIVAPYYNYSSGELDIYVTSDLWDDVSGTVDMLWLDLEGNPIADNGGMASSTKFTVGGLNTTLVLSTNVLSELNLTDASDAILILSLTSTGTLPNSDTRLTFTHSNHFMPSFPNAAKLRDPNLSLSYDSATKMFTVEATGGVSLYTWLTHPGGHYGLLRRQCLRLVTRAEERDWFHLDHRRDGRRLDAKRYGSKHLGPGTALRAECLPGNK